MRDDAGVHLLQRKAQPRGPGSGPRKHHQCVLPFDYRADVCRERRAKLGSKDPAPKLLMC